MSTDRELLELAAKAAGFEKFRWIEQNICAPEGPVCDGQIWNPLTDDGDALRLAVKIGQTEMIDLYLGQNQCLVDFDGGVDPSQYREPHGTDPYAATRRAIVRAAAELGRKS